VGGQLFTAANAAAARSAIGAAETGANNDILSLGALTTVPAVVTAAMTPPVRQTVLSGPVDTSGLAAFGGSTGSTTVTAAGTLTATASNGVAGDRTGSIVNPSWTGLSTNGAMFLYLDIAANGTCTTGSTTLAPTYRWGGADVTTNNQATFNIQEMQMKVGNGATAAQTYRVFVGEVTVAGAVVTAITWYALMGRYSSGRFAIAASTAYNRNHNIGVPADFLDYSSFGASTVGGALYQFMLTVDGGPTYRGIGIGLTSRTAAALYTNAAYYIQTGTNAGDVTPDEAILNVWRGW
jgi:hypothetical protein